MCSSSTDHNIVSRLLNLLAVGNLSVTLQGIPNSFPRTAYHPHSSVAEMVALRLLPLGSRQISRKRRQLYRFLQLVAASHGLASICRQRSPSRAINHLQALCLLYVCIVRRAINKLQCFLRFYHNSQLKGLLRLLPLTWCSACIGKANHETS